MVKVLTFSNASLALFNVMWYPINNLAQLPGYLQYYLITNQCRPTAVQVSSLSPSLSVSRFLSQPFEPGSIASTLSYNRKHIIDT